jgi:peptidoglycan/LPS O-acetylase OafA/YrhL
MENRSRVQILDGLRVLAILMVMIFHFYARYQGKYYSYNFKIPGFLIHGRLGVQLFFVISGFVITLTLAKSKDFFEFLVKRFIRLLPGMIICATLTFLFFSIFDKNNLIPGCKNINNLFISWTFISPALVNIIFKSDLQYIDGSYWTIWTELQFYVVGGILYFFSPKNFMKNYLAIVVLSFPVAFFFTSAHFSEASVNLLGQHVAARSKLVFTVFNLFTQNCWFLAGIVLNKIYFAQNKELKLVALFAGIFVVEMFVHSNIQITLILCVILTIFLLFLYKPEYLSFLGNPTLSKIGVASYSIYLIHEYNGYLIMDRLAPSLKGYNWVIPVFLVSGSTLFALWIYRFLEKPTMDALRRWLLKKTNKSIPNLPLAAPQAD